MPEWWNINPVIGKVSERSYRDFCAGGARLKKDSAGRKAERKVAVCDNGGEVVKRYDTARQLAEELDVSPASVYACARRNEKKRQGNFNTVKGRVVKYLAHSWEGS